MNKIKLSNKKVLFFGPVPVKKKLKLNKEQLSYSMYIVQKKNSSVFLRSTRSSSKLIIYFKGKNVNVPVKIYQKYKSKIACFIGNFKKTIKNIPVLHVEHMPDSNYFNMLLKIITKKKPKKLVIENVFISGGINKPLDNNKKYAAIHDMNLCNFIMKNDSINIPLINIGINSLLRYKRIIFIGPGPLSSRSIIDYNKYNYIVLTHHMITLFDDVLDKYKHLEIIPFFNHYYATNHKKDIDVFVKKYSKRISKIICRKLSVNLFSKTLQNKLVQFGFKKFYTVHRECQGPLSLIKILYLFKNTGYKEFRITGITFYSNTDMKNNYISKYRVDKSRDYKQQFIGTDKKHNLIDNAQYLKTNIKLGFPIIIDNAVELIINQLTTKKPVTVITKKPVTVITKKPVTVITKKPVTVIAKKPVTVIAKKPVTVIAKKPVTVIAKKPMTVNDSDKKQVIYVDIDETICHHDKTAEKLDYTKAIPYYDRIKKINNLFDNGHQIFYWTARGTVTKIDWLQVTTKQLTDWKCKYHGLKMGKPFYDLFIDDKNINSEMYFSEN
jgi:hypothetical protein